MKMICDNLTVKNNTLYFGGRSTAELIEKYGSPLYVMDENKLRENCRTYVNAMREHFGEGSLPLFASKACSFKRIYQIIMDEGMFADVVSVGEIYTALKAGFPPEKLYFHSNSKTDDDIRYAVENGVGTFVADNFEELDYLDDIAREKGITQNILLRITPGIDTHTYEAVNTGKVDSKFGFPIETGSALKAAEYALSKKNLNLRGIHCHVGSQLFDSDVFVRSADLMIGFINTMKAKLGYVTEELDLGGGYGVRYTENDPEINIAENIGFVAAHCKKKCAELGLKMPLVHMEPGRSIVADAGITLYTVGNVKRIEGYKNYVAVDGGMGDNPRFALYGSAYTVITANKAEEKATFKADLVGRFCESGDKLQPAVLFPESVSRGDTVAVLTTGAYNYSMASNYNRIPRLPIIMVCGDSDYVAVRRESLDDLVRNDV